MGFMGSVGSYVIDGNLDALLELKIGKGLEVT